MSMAFLVTTLIVVVTPGTGVIYTLSAGVSHGRRASVIAALGCAIGAVPHMVAAVTGLAALLHTSAVAFEALRYLGVAYLLYLALATLRDRDTIVVATQTAQCSFRPPAGAPPPPRRAAGVIISAVLINLLNPKLTMFFFAFLPQFVNPGEPDSWLRMLALSSVFILLTFVVFAGYGIFAAAVRAHVISRPRVLTWMRRAFAGSFVALGARLAFADR